MCKICNNLQKTVKKDNFEIQNIEQLTAVVKKLLSATGKKNKNVSLTLRSNLGDEMLHF